MNKKRGQVTLFIILGIILLLIGGTVIYFITRTPDVEEVEVERRVEVSVASQPIQTYVQECIQSTAKQGVVLMQQGGYINLTESFPNIKADATNPTESDVLVVMEGIQLPYWLYMKSSNNCLQNCKFDTKKPNLYKTSGEPSVEGQLERYLESELSECVDNLNAFSEQGYVLIEEGEPIADIVVTSGSLDIQVDYPITFEYEESTTDLQRFNAELDFDFQGIFELAEELINAETTGTTNFYLERNTLNWIQGFSGVTRDKLPPPFGQGDCDENVFWTTPEVENKLKPVLSTYVSAIQPAGINNQIDLTNAENDMQLSLYSQAIIPINNTISSGYEVSYDYLDWPIYFVIDPERGGLIEPNTIGAEPIGFCLTEYKFAYDVSYPVLVTITDPEAFNGEGYSLQFAMEANIRNNEPMNESASYSLEAEIPVIAEEPMLCNRNQRLSGEITVNAKDARTNEALEDAMVSFCIPDATGSCVDSCLIGVTDAEGKLKEKFPLGQGLIILNKKPDYYPYAAAYLTQYNQEGELTIPLEPYRTLDVDVIKKIKSKEICYTKHNCTWNLTDTEKTLETGESAVISMTRMDRSYSQHTQSIFFQPGLPNQTVELIPGNYEVNILITTDKTINIPEDEICVGIIFRECTPLEALDLENVPGGGVTINNETGYLEITESELDAGRFIRFYTISPDFEDIETHFDIGQLTTSVNQTKDYVDKVMPVVA